MVENYVFERKDKSVKPSDAKLTLGIYGYRKIVYV